MQIWANGLLTPNPDDATISVLDHVVTVGDGVFEVIKVDNGAPFALTRHMRRLANSAQGLGLPAPDEALVRSAVDEVLAAEHIPCGRLRITYTGGVAPLSSERDDPKPGLLVASIAAPRPPATVAVVTVPWVRNERGALAGLKTTSYGENVLALELAHTSEASEAIFANTRGELCEGTGTNIFCVLDDVVVTPPLTSGCLAGITRALVLEWCDVEERDVTMDEYRTSNQMFLTSSTRDVQAIHTVDGRPLEAPGDATAVIAETFGKRSADDLDP
jgi:branched-chain amino acid aminotransferase